MTEAVEPEHAIEADLRAAATAQRYHETATLALARYGDELLGYIAAMTRDQTRADDAFSLMLENLWKGLPGFRWECSFRTWSYRIARNAVYRITRDHKPVVSLDDTPELAELATPFRTRTATYLRTESRDRLAELRAALDPDDQTLLILRINRKLAWPDIARALEDTDDAAAIARRAAALRKRFQRLKDELREQLRPRRTS